MALPEKLESAEKLNRSELPEKQRIYALAKQLGVASKDLLQVVLNLGISGKVASSTLTLAEQNQVLDALSGTAEAVEADATAVEEPAEEPAEEESADKTEPEALVEVLPEITPPPSTEPPVTAPVFSAPVFAAPTFSNADGAAAMTPAPANDSDEDSDDDSESGSASDSSKRRRRGSRGRGRGRGAQNANNEREANAADNTSDDKPTVDEPEEIPEIDEPMAIKGSTRLEAQRRRRVKRKAMQDRPAILSEAEFLARRESVSRRMVVRDRKRRSELGRSNGEIITQIGVLEDDLLVEHFVATSDQASQVGNIYLGRVQNVLPSMEAAFIDIGTGRNGVLYAGELDWRAFGKAGRSRKIEKALKSGDQVLVQVTKDPLGHKGARLSTQISIAGRFLVYVPNGRSAGISRKLPAPERKRLKDILRAVVPEDTGIIIRTAAEGVEKQKIERDVQRLAGIWEHVQERTEQEMASKGAKPVMLYEEPDTLIKVVRDLFTEDFDELIVEGERSWNTVQDYVHTVAPDLEERLVQYEASEHDDADVFEHYRIEEQIAKALARKVWLPSGGTLVIDRTEAMTVIDVNTGKFTGAGGNLEETVTLNNLEAAEEIVRQMRLRDLGGMIVVDFIDMVLPENQELVLRRLREFLGRDRTKHQVSEVTSLGLVQMTRKKLGTGLLETFSTPCTACGGRGLILHEDPVQESETDERPSRQNRPRRGRDEEGQREGGRRRRERQRPARDPQQHPAALAMSQHDEDADQAEAKAELKAEPKPEPKPDTKQDAQESQQGSGRRRGRRVTRKNAAEQAAESSVEQIAAEALAVAESEDPDEPSGRDYVPEADFVVDLREETEQRTVRRSRSRSRRRGSAQSLVNDKKQEPAKEEAEPESAKAEEAKADEAKAEPTQGRRRRRVRVSRSFEEAPKQELPKAESKSVDSAETTESYEEQLAEFEKSPRRKRRTRGRSASDFPPAQPEVDSSDAKAEKPAKVTKPTKRAAEAEPAEAASEVRVQRRGRGGRRVVRRG